MSLWPIGRQFRRHCGGAVTQECAPEPLAIATRERIASSAGVVRRRDMMVLIGGVPVEHNWRATEGPIDRALSD